jgi:hypothetical protein
MHNQNNVLTSNKKAEDFYNRVIALLLGHNMPFMVGGTYAFSAYTGIERPTKDIDIKCAFEDYPTILKTFSDAGFKTEISEEQWIAKVHEPDHCFFTDVIFAEKNGLAEIDRGWMRRARDGTILGHKVKLEPIEDMISSKAFIQQKERFDGADVINLIYKYSDTIDWKFLANKIEPHWEILFAHLVNFIFVYPSEKKAIPKWLLENYLNRATKEFLTPTTKTKLTRGLLISSQYQPAVTQWGFHPVVNEGYGK